MATTHKQIDAPPERVWAVLADADNYAHWVVGSRDVRDADASFPARGASFHHTFAFGPLDLRDVTEVVESDAPRRLVLHVKARPLGRGTVELDLTAVDGGTHVTMHEGPASPVARLFYNPLMDVVLYGRNVEALRRLAALAEGEHAEPRTSGNAGRDAGGGEDGPAVGPGA